MSKQTIEVDGQLYWAHPGGRMPEELGPEDLVAVVRRSGRVDRAPAGAFGWASAIHDVRILGWKRYGETVVRGGEPTNPDAPAETPKHSHYFKDVSHLKTVDVYRVLDLFGVTDPCLQHAVKKLLVAGGRGHKDIVKDVAEAKDSLARWEAMRAEDAAR